MKKLELSKETLRVLSNQDTTGLMAGLPVTYTDLICPTERATLCLPTVCHARDCGAVSDNTYCC